MTRRLLNLGLCIVLLPFALPLMVLIGLLVWLDSPGPAMFIHVRASKKGRQYRVYKFRTMQWNLDASTHHAPMGAFETGVSDISGGFQVVHKPFHEMQVTRVGRILRATRLDQLPQIFNVLKGDMSLVGGSPSVPPEVDAYRESS